MVRLLEGEARTAQRAIHALADSPEQTVHLLSKRLKPMTADRAVVDKLLVNLESDAFTERESASRNLARIRDCVAPKLQKVLQEKPSLELRQRIETILAETRRLPVETVRTLRAIAVLERIGTPEARCILETLCTGAAVPETRAAQAALERLTHPAASGTRIPARAARSRVQRFQCYGWRAGLSSTEGLSIMRPPDSLICGSSISSIGRENVAPGLWAEVKALLEGSGALR